MAWLAGWSYRKAITLSRASGAVTNYQMKLLVGESSGATGEDVDCAAHVATDFDDLRFTAADGTTPLDYWIESITGATPNQLATVWIEFDSIGTGATTFYMYYGNAGAAAASNGANTFIAFQDFNALSTAQLQGQGSWSGGTSMAVEETVVAEGTKAVIGTANNDCFLAVTNTGWKVFLEGKVRKNSIAAGGEAHFSFSQNGRGTITGIGFQTGALIRLLDNTPWVNLYTALANTWYSVRVEMTAANKVKGYVNGTDYVGEKTTYQSVTGNIDQIRVETWSLGGGVYGYFDCLKVGKFEVTGPAWGSWGVEEAPPAGGARSFAFVMIV